MTTLKLPTTYHLKTILWAKIYPGGDRPYFDLSPTDMVPYGYFKLRDVDIELPLPWEKIGDPVLAQVEGLKGQIVAMRATSEAAITEVQENINKLLAIEYHPEPTTDSVEDFPF